MDQVLEANLPGNFANFVLHISIQALDLDVDIHV